MAADNKHSSFKDTVAPQRRKQRIPVRKKLLRALINLLAIVGIAMLYYAAFSFFFDTPVEYRMKNSTAELRKEYEILSGRYDTLERVLNNVVERDRAVFHTLFDSYPYDLMENNEQNRLKNYEKLITKTNRELGDEFLGKFNSLDKKATAQSRLQDKLEHNADSLKFKLDYVPAIQPVINNDLTLLTASYGLLMHPFYKTLASHQGVDFTVSEGSSVFATADGTVKDIIVRQTTSGTTVVIDHRNGYETTYGHLSKVNVRKGQQVRRGDIIAQSGNTGLSLAPHLHYEIKYHGMRIDPIHYFFMELNYNDYWKIIRIAQSGMQSFD